jgi:hypothetical protein
LGFDKTYSKITERWWWPGIYRDTRHYVESCTVCGRMTSGASAHVAAPLQSILVHETFELVGIDIVGKLSTTAANNKFILVITDHLSKWAFAIALSEITTAAVADALLHKVILAGHGVPRRILTDRGSNFNSALAHEIYRVLNIAKSTTTAYHPQCDGHTERFNATLCSMLSKMMEEHPMDWDELLDHCTFNYNASKHASTQLSPYYVVYGKEPRLPLEHVLGHVNYPPAANVSAYTKQLVQRIHDAEVIARTNLHVAQERQTNIANAALSHSLNPFMPGDLVWVRRYTVIRSPKSRKFLPKWIGPATVVHQTSPVNYVVKGNGIAEQTMHVSRLRLYTERDAKFLEPSSDTPILSRHDSPEAPIVNTPAYTAPGEASREEEEDDDDYILRILQKSEIGRPRYLVEWKSSKQTWIDEEDMNCPELLVEFTKANIAKTNEPHYMLKTLIEALAGMLKAAKSHKPPGLVTLKRRLRELVGLGNPYLRSRRCCYDLEKQLTNTTTLSELTNLLDTWVTQPNSVFAAEWDHDLS